MQLPVQMVLTGMEVNLTPMGSHTSLRDMAWGGFPNATGDGREQGTGA